MAQYALKDVFDFTVHEFNPAGYGGDVVFDVDYASSAELETTAERTEIKGGRGNYTLVAYDHTKAGVFRATLPLIDLEALALFTGKKIKTDNIVVPNREVLTVDENNTVTLKYQPYPAINELGSGDISSLKVYPVVDNRDQGVEFKLASIVGEGKYVYDEETNTIEFNDDVAKGTQIKVFYDYQIASGAKQITMTASDFPQAMRITGTGIMENEYTGEDEVVSFEVLQAKMQSGFNLTVSSDGSNPAELPLEFDMYSVIEGNDKVYYKWVVLPVDDED